MRLSLCLPDELDFLQYRGWEVFQNASKDILIGSRTNNVGSSIRQLAGSTLVGVAHSHLPLTYAIVEIVYGKTLPAGQQGYQNEFADSCYTATLTRAGSDRIRVCMFHMSNTVAASKVALAHEALATMICDCMYYQVDLIGGDANMALYRAGGRKQESMDIKGGMYMNILDYFIEAWNNSPESMPFCAPRVQHVTANSLGLLKQYEDQLGHDKYRNCVAPDWNTFPGLDPLVATVMEWGHSMDDDQWGNYPSARFEYKVHVSEWLLNATNAAYLLGDRDTDSHTPLQIDVHANQYDRARTKTLNRNP